MVGPGFFFCFRRLCFAHRCSWATPDTEPRPCARAGFASHFVARRPVHGQLANQPLAPGPFVRRLNGAPILGPPAWPFFAARNRPTSPKPPPARNWRSGSGLSSPLFDHQSVNGNAPRPRRNDQTFFALMWPSPLNKQSVRGDGAEHMDDSEPPSPTGGRPLCLFRNVPGISWVFEFSGGNYLALSHHVHFLSLDCFPGAPPPLFFFPDFLWPRSQVPPTARKQSGSVLGKRIEKRKCWCGRLVWHGRRSPYFFSLRRGERRWSGPFPAFPIGNDAIVAAPRPRNPSSPTRWAAPLERSPPGGRVFSPKAGKSCSSWSRKSTSTSPPTLCFDGPRNKPDKSRYDGGSLEMISGPPPKWPPRWARSGRQ